MYAGDLDLAHPLFWTVEDVLTAGECAAFIERIEALGCEAAPVTTGVGAVMMPETRNNARVIIDDAATAAMLWERVRGRVPDVLSGMRAVGANERLRCYRYRPGERFAPHYDGTFIRNDDERSLLTFMVYLNEGFEGGETDFPMLKQTVRPKTGMALLFQHAILHEGCRVKSGVKYAVRSDVMYRRVAPTKR